MNTIPDADPRPLLEGTDNSAALVEILSRYGVERLGGPSSHREFHCSMASDHSSKYCQMEREKMHGSYAGRNQNS